ncbi:hypothetical protein HDV05_008705 [Chytridiales sp. JEL 0842]|nr:hypothetical protein HDV05_008705 [Chytridiales sp. JEL 0842]
MSTTNPATGPGFESLISKVNTTWDTDRMFAQAEPSLITFTPSEGAKEGAEGNHLMDTFRLGGSRLSLRVSRGDLSRTRLSLGVMAVGGGTSDGDGDHTTGGLEAPSSDAGFLRKLSMNATDLARNMGGRRLSGKVRDGGAEAGARFGDISSESMVRKESSIKETYNEINEEDEDEGQQSLTEEVKLSDNKFDDEDAFISLPHRSSIPMNSTRKTSIPQQIPSIFNPNLEGEPDWLNNALGPETDINVELPRESTEHLNTNLASDSSDVDSINSVPEITIQPASEYTTRIQTTEPMPPSFSITKTTSIDETTLETPATPLVRPPVLTLLTTSPISSPTHKPRILSGVLMTPSNGVPSSPSSRRGSTLLPRDPQVPQRTSRANSALFAIPSTPQGLTGKDALTALSAIGLNRVGMDGSAEKSVESTEKESKKDKKANEGEEVDDSSAQRYANLFSVLRKPSKRDSEVSEVRINSFMAAASIAGGLKTVGEDPALAAKLDLPNLQMLIALKKWAKRKKNRKGAPVHLSPFVKDLDRRMNTELPRPLAHDLLDDVMGMVEKYVVRYHTDLGPKHSFSVASKLHMERLIKRKEMLEGKGPGAIIGDVYMTEEQEGRAARAMEIKARMQKSHEVLHTSSKNDSQSSIANRRSDKGSDSHLDSKPRHHSVDIDGEGSAGGLRPPGLGNLVKKVLADSKVQKSSSRSELKVPDG